ncbi:hypothetical protein C0585_08170 [Candidatus Woesearchaeota archaeon]|nr:MAG: hypothetical protein C0585_08170 [Candidatus Woesearchaeota archaeon]
MYLKFLKKLAHFQTHHPYISLLIIAVLTVMIYGGVSKVMTVASLENMMPKDVEEIRAFNLLRDNGMGQDIIAIVISVDPNSMDEEGIFDVRDKRVYTYLKHLTENLVKQPDVHYAYSYVDVVNMAAYNMQVNPDDYYEMIIYNYELDNELSNFINHDYSNTIIILTSDVAANDPRMDSMATAVKKIIEDAGYPPGVNIELTGTPVIQQKLGELIGNDRKSTQWISTLFVFLIVMILFGTFTSAIVPIIVVTTSVNWLYGTMGYTGLPISTLAGGVAAMVIGIGIDFSIHLINKFKFERKKGKDVKQSIELAVTDIGIALTFTTLATVSAFLAFLIGEMPEMGRFGLLMSIGITYSLIFSIFGLPALLIVEEKVIYWLKKKLKFGIEGELKLMTSDEVCPPGFKAAKLEGTNTRLRVKEEDYKKHVRGKNA